MQMNINKPPSRKNETMKIYSEHFVLLGFRVFVILFLWIPFSMFSFATFFLICPPSSVALGQVLIKSCQFNAE